MCIIKKIYINLQKKEVENDEWKTILKITNYNIYKPNNFVLTQFL